MAGVALSAAGLLGCEPPVDPDPDRSPTSEGGSAAASSRPWTEGKTADGTWNVTWRPVPVEIPSLEPFAVEVEVRRPDGTPLPADLAVLVDATMPHHGHGMNVRPAISPMTGDDSVGRFLAEGMLLHMPGRWEFTIDVVRGDDVERAQWTVMLDD